MLDSVKYVSRKTEMLTTSGEKNLKCMLRYFSEVKGAYVELHTFPMSILEANEQSQNVGLDKEKLVAAHEWQFAIISPEG